MKTCILALASLALFAQQPPSPFNIPSGHKTGAPTVVTPAPATVTCVTVPFTLGFKPVYPQLLENGQPDLNASHTLVDDFAMDDFLHGRCYDAGVWENLPDSQLWATYYASEALVGVGPLATSGLSAKAVAKPFSGNQAALAATVAQLQKVLAALQQLSK